MTCDKSGTWAQLSLVNGWGLRPSDPALNLIRDSILMSTFVRGLYENLSDQYFKILKHIQTYSFLKFIVEIIEAENKVFRTTVNIAYIIY